MSNLNLVSAAFNLIKGCAVLIPVFVFLCETLRFQDLLLSSPIAWKFFKRLNNVEAVVEKAEGPLGAEKPNYYACLINCDVLNTSHTVPLPIF